jgi:hypothetical protein
MIYIIHYMDDSLLAGKDHQYLFLYYRDLQQVSADKGLQMAPKKVQTQDPCNDLGFRLTNQVI